MHHCRIVINFKLVCNCIISKKFIEVFMHLSHSEYNRRNRKVGVEIYIKACVSKEEEEHNRRISDLDDL